MYQPGRFIVAAWLVAPLVALATGCRTPALNTSMKLPSSMASMAPTQVADNVQQAFKKPNPNREIALASFAEAEKIFDAAAAEGTNRPEAFRQAVKPYEVAAENAPQTTIEEDALMMVAESHYFADEYADAAQAYDLLIKRYPRTRHLDQIDQRRFAISQYWIELTKNPTASSWLPNLTDKQRPTTDTFGFATKNLDKIRFDNPTGKLADDATLAAAIAHFERKKWGQADILFTDIRENFPSSEHQFQAHLLGLKCKQELYRGPDYAGGMLDEAEKIIRQIYAQFPEKAAEQNELLQAAYKDVRLKKAEREYEMARYYDNRAEFGAARMYYDGIKRQYKDTNLALESEDRITSISQFPDMPNESLGWLGKLFPKEKHRTKPLFQRNTVDLGK